MLDFCLARSHGPAMLSAQQKIARSYVLTQRIYILLIHFWIIHYRYLATNYCTQINEHVNIVAYRSIGSYGSVARKRKNISHATCNVDYSILTGSRGKAME